MIGGLYQNTLSNGFNTGNILVENATSEGIGSIVGNTNNSNIIENSFYLKDTYKKAIGEMTDWKEDNNDVTELENITDFPRILEVVNSDKAFKEDTDNINNGYPILNYQV